MRMTRECFYELFQVHPPDWCRSLWVKGQKYVFIDRGREVEELEGLLCPGGEPLVTA